MLNDLWQMVLGYLPQVFSFAITLVVFWFIAKIANAVIGRIGCRMDIQFIWFFQKIVKYSIWIFGVATALTKLGFDVTAMTAGLGVSAFALGYAMKDIISNLLSGVLIVVFRTLKQNDLIKVERYEGRVEAIDLRYTVLNDGKERHLIPNSKLFSNIVTICEESDDDEHLVLRTFSRD